MRKLTIEDAESIAYTKDGRCLSSEYINNKVNMVWECNVGHTWKAPYRNIRSGSWCHECTGLKIKTIDDMRNMAKSKGGKCNSNKYINMHHKVKWECSEGHNWSAKPADIKHSKSWCPA